MPNAVQKLGEGIPPFEPLDPFCERWGWSRSFAYLLAGRGKIRFLKVESKTYGDNESALSYFRSCPEAGISPPVDRHPAAPRPDKPAKASPNIEPQPRGRLRKRDLHREGAGV